ncbi:hypothetical protein [Hamadaea tsunoensis]|uniref:hypothetical protein n=1 Tax=Hamadaea tsunoensis TaxID=53368 RepID=UPI0003FFF29A|nr:hypothetical protein [Hamadaea tsunoensis]
MATDSTPADADGPASTDGPAGTGSPKPAEQQPPKQPHWLTAGHWAGIGAIAGILSVAIAVAVAVFPPKSDGPGTAQPNSANSITGTSAGTPSPGAQSTAGASGPPVLIESVTPLSSDPDLTLVLADKVELTAAQLSRLDSEGLQNLEKIVPLTTRPVPVRFGFTNVTLMGNAAATVTITQLEIDKKCRPPLTGTLLYSPSQGAGDTIKMIFDLDGTAVVAQNASGLTATGSYFKDHIVTLAPGEAQTLSITVKSDQHDCTFTLRMTVAGPTGTVVENIDDNGQPFELTAAPPHNSDYQAVYLSPVYSPSRHWTRVDPARAPGR